MHMKGRRNFLRCLAALIAAATRCALMPSAAASTGALTDYTVLSGYHAPEIAAPAACMIEINTGAILFSKNADAQYPPASTMKILTALVAIEQGDLNEIVTYSYNAINDIEDGGNNKDFKEGETMSLRSCIELMLMVSSNEAAYAIAEHVGGTMPDFVEMLNRKAVSIGATHSNFCNPNGLNNDEQYVTALDLALIMRECVKNPVFLEIASAESCCVTDTSIRTEGFAYANRDKMMLLHNEFHRDYVVCGKTGYTSKAGNALVTYASMDGMDVVCAVLHGDEYEDVYADTITLCDYAFAEYAFVPMSALFDETVTSQLGESTIRYGEPGVLMASWFPSGEPETDLTPLTRHSWMLFTADLTVRPAPGVELRTGVTAVPVVPAVRPERPVPSAPPEPEPEASPPPEPEAQEKEPLLSRVPVWIPYAAACLFLLVALLLLWRNLSLRRHLASGRTSPGHSKK